MARPPMLGILLFAAAAAQAAGYADGSRGRVDTAACTSIVAGGGAMRNGHPMTSHTNDCADCDFRLSRVPPIAIGTDKELLVYAGRGAYPRFLGAGRGNTYLEINTDVSIYPWSTRSASFQPIARIPEPTPAINLTYAWIDGAYGIINERQVAIGESTCGALLTTKAVQNGGKALFDAETLTRIALPRCATARCVVRLIGDLAVKYGFHGEDDTQIEGGESLQITDPDEAWVFHILADDTGTSAVWAAQRVPDGHVTVVANQFIIRKLNLSDPDNFMASDNVEEVARRAGLWPRRAYSCTPGDLLKEPLPGSCPSSAAYHGEFDFTAAYGLSRGRVFAPYATRRMWRVLTMAAPGMTQHILPETNELADDYPFSVEPDVPLDITDIFEMLRDHYEGTPYDMTRGLAAGPYGDVARFDISPHFGLYPSYSDNLTPREAYSGFYERALSIYRASYSWVSLSRSGADNFAHIWFGQYAPHATQYLPLYVLPKRVPTEFDHGSLYKYDPTTQYWVQAALANYAARFYVFTIKDIKALQRQEERRILAQQRRLEAELVGQGKPEIESALQSFQEEAASRSIDSWTELFHLMLARFKDGQRVDDFHTESIKPVKLFYPKNWLESTSYFKIPMSIVDEKNTIGEREGVKLSSLVHRSGNKPDGWQPSSGLAAVYATASGLICGLVGAAIGYRLGRTYYGYESILY